MDDFERRVAEEVKRQVAEKMKGFTTTVKRMEGGIVGRRGTMRGEDHDLVCRCLHPDTYASVTPEDRERALDAFIHADIPHVDGVSPERWMDARRAKELPKTTEELLARRVRD